MSVEEKDTPSPITGTRTQNFLRVEKARFTEDKNNHLPPSFFFQLPIAKSHTFCAIMTSSNDHRNFSISFPLN